MLKIDEPSGETETHPLWRLGFRAGFLAAGLFAVAAMARWMWWMYRPSSWDFSLHPAWWHAHEMVFGFAMPVVAGFLLTAVANWTGIAGTRGRRLQELFALWLAARLILWLLPSLWMAAWLAEMLFIALLTWEVSRRVWAAQQRRNMLFTPVLLALAAFSSVSFWAVEDLTLARQAHYGSVWMITLLITIIGGRVTPMFTANRLGLKIPPLPLWFEGAVIVLTALIGLATVLIPDAPVLRPLYLVGGLLHLVRLAAWRGWKTGSVPLLWSMHLSYLFIPLAMLGLCWQGSDAGTEKNLLHLLAIGSIGGMIIAMMSRVSLGHTGRPLEIPGYLAGAFAMILLAALVRALLPEFDGALTLQAWRISAGLWIAAFALWLLRYLPVLTRPRADGKAG